ncbi:MAG: L-threonylcarbamoyladenylate synthase [Pseudomonadota bacterium]|nr:L-threonylcarbamoyladenylate synthase [Pseudomonadota bacterium]
MNNIYSNIKKFNSKTQLKVIHILNSDGLIALPTETVYGLAGNAYSREAVKKIFKIKNRPKINPIIVHYFTLKEASKDIFFPKKFLKLYRYFCPGPITFILKKKKYSNINKLTTAGLDSVAVRFPKHKVLRKILRKINFPLAMPSANKSGKVSPTCAKHVYNQFGKKIIIVDGGNSRVGIESTVVDLTSDISILRPGTISSKQIQKILGKKIIYKKSKKIRSPGNLKNHYSPGIPIKLNAKKSEKNSAFITIGKKFKKSKGVYNLSEKSNLKEAAKNLYKTLITIKKKKYKKISVMKIPNIGVGIAINDRLKRAAAK